MSLVVAIILILAVLILVVAVANTQIITITPLPNTEFIIEGKYTILDNTSLLPEEKE